MNKQFFQDFLMLSQIQTAIILFILLVVFYMLKKMRDIKINFSFRMLFALFLGLGFGFVLQYLANFPDSKEINSIVWYNETKHWLGFISSIFVGFIKMLIVPLISVCIIKVLIEIDKNIKISSLLSISLFWILLSTTIAASLGIFLAYSFHLGSDFAMLKGKASEREIQTFSNIILDLIPSNIVTAINQENIIAVVIFSFFVGISAKKIAKKEEYEQAFKSFENFIMTFYNIMMNMTATVIRFMPYAVVCMMSNVILSNGFEAIKTAGLFIMLIYMAMFIMFGVHFLLLASQGLNPIKYAKKAFPVWLFAFSSRSSLSTLPMTTSTLENQFGVNSAVANFVASIGTTVGLNGCAGYFPAMAAVFVAFATHTPIDFSFALMIVLIAVIGSLGIAGVPGSATMATSIMLAGIGFGNNFVMLSLILAIDPIIDMARTASNVSGSMTSALCSAKNLKALNKKIYNS
ncbi:cation:dicarboxylase symporter family transporter [Campylobacter sp. VicNov18]|uniref:cation:dicarboxylate symporter family transporter n=1 Tax=Campylobacter bilis TaxID=2691918 RepID=UPI00130E6D98|nr:cation:dicarboxylase symporter family transporter [Campylobacter bilis]MPV64037.1 cation:dicarboxylase symporter family transporter [Campylobacter hepaticus]MBM0637539.1 cation:dicarboxylase symporter family transporter [Campylobacter bilis]MCC8278261.1 cation:dicarboxylase symporter family transporter [Campylobacter bilis]MCC8299765.1 cation:dicarboxylase symporter family transporter [Campylobacter bilis]MCC8301170.1 cation:dicarboxylase symporter family transporter [Campylobacter bilis]